MTITPDTEMISTILQKGDRVEHVKLGKNGTVDHADHNHVRVKWDGGEIGMLFYDGSTAARAKDLIRLPPNDQSSSQS